MFRFRIYACYFIAKKLFMENQLYIYIYIYIILYIHICISTINILTISLLKTLDVIIKHYSNTKTFSIRMIGCVEKCANN